MKRNLILGSVIASSLFLTVSARSGPLWRQKLSQAPVLNPPSIAMPPVDAAPAQDPSSGVILSDVLGRDRSINIFSGFTRDVDTISARLDDGSRNATILAPENGAITSLPRKPWENARDYETLGANAYEGADGPARAQGNLERFVSAHIVPESPWGENQKMQTLAGSTVWWEHKDGKKLLQPGDIEIISIADKVANGEVWIIRGVLNYA